MTPTNCTSLVIKENVGSAPQLVKRLVPLPTPAEHELLVKVSHVAQNPTDGMYCPNDEIETTNRNLQFYPSMPMHSETELSLGAISLEKSRTPAQMLMASPKELPSPV
jgi:hypothetical protein